MRCRDCGQELTPTYLGVPPGWATGVGAGVGGATVAVGVGACVQAAANKITKVIEAANPRAALMPLAYHAET